MCREMVILCAAIVSACLAAGATEPAAPAAAPLEAARPAAPQLVFEQDDPELRPLREALGQAKEEVAWSRAARGLLAALEKRGQGESSESTWLIDRLNYVEPNQPEWVWRRGNLHRKQDHTKAAIEDFEKLVLMAPNDPLAVRALRALPELYVKAGDLRAAAAADERLLAQNLADPLPVLGRLIRTYETLGFEDKMAQALEALRRIGGDAAMQNADLQWLSAEAAQRAGEQDKSTEQLLDFAKKFPGDKREPEALLRAAQNLKGVGQEAMALDLAAQAIEKAGDQTFRARGYIERADLLERQGKLEAAEKEYENVLHGTPDLMQVAVALHGLVRLTLAHHGLPATIFRLAAVAQGFDRFAAPLAKRHIETLLRKNADKIAELPIDAAAVTELARRLGILKQVPAALRLSAAQLREDLGARPAAAQLYATLLDEPGAVGEAARRGMLRCDPSRPLEAIAVDDLERLAALKRGERWDQIEEALMGRLDGRGGITKRALVARAAFLRKDLTRVSEVLEPLQPVSGEAALLRGDERALAGRWDAACEDYTAAAPYFDSGPEHAWIEVRLANCDARFGRPDDARQRLKAVIESKPLEPAAFAAKSVMERLPPPEEDVGPAGPGT